MRMLLDTYNILHTTGVLPPELAGVDVKELIDLIRLSRYRAHESVLVCDGAESADSALTPGAHAGDEGRIIIRYAGKGNSADDVIAKLVQRSTTPRRWTVVSSDHAVLKTARRRKCKTLTAEEFLQHLANDVGPRLSGVSHARRRKPVAAKSSTPSITPAQVDRWMKLFKVDEAALAAQAEQAAEEMHAGPPAAKPATVKKDESRQASAKAAAPVKKDHAVQRTRRRGKARHRASAVDLNDAAPPPALPDDLIAQAEQLLRARTDRPRQ